jgi:hypothetical protein
MFALILAFATGCAPPPIAAEYLSTLVVPEGGSFTMDSAYTTPGDGIGLLVENSVMVLDPDDLPSPGIQVDVVSGWSGAYVIPEGAVRVVADYQVGCEGSDDESCQAFFDAGNQQYVEFAGEYDEVEDFRPTYMSDTTDNRGFMTFYTFIDSVPTSEEDGTPESITVYVSIGVDDGTVTYSFAGGS